MVTFGPVPSRRLGRSLGVNNVPFKSCNYSCVYCQLGRTPATDVEPRKFFDPEKVCEDVEQRLSDIRKTGEAPVDFITFVPDGEPTLDINLGQEIDLLKPLGIKIAVITNSSLIWREDVRNNLMNADWVSLKVDSVREDVWQKINRPDKTLRLRSIMDGMLAFSKAFEGELTTETMLMKGVNDNSVMMTETADFISRLTPSRTYISVPTRPPSEKWVLPPDEQELNRCFQIFNEKLQSVEYLIGYEGDSFAYSGNVEADILGITAVHPMREDAVRNLLAKAGSGWSVVERMMEQGKLVKTEYRGEQFYLRKPSRPID
ncbi:MAG: radical SAM protein [Deltaproteobacteria bacterium]|nr:radical SAM protein [Deltaproteobacteria bacterium]MBZ0219890.1 radical SAM protein [Deltaproteobacteria bacterium]